MCNTACLCSAEYVLTLYPVKTVTDTLLNMNTTPPPQHSPLTDYSFNRLPPPSVRLTHLDLGEFHRTPNVCEQGRQCTLLNSAAGWYISECQSFKTVTVIIGLTLCFSSSFFSTEWFQVCVFFSCWWQLLCSVTLKSFETLIKIPLHCLQRIFSPSPPQNFGFCTVSSSEGQYAT